MEKQLAAAINRSIPDPTKVGKGEFAKSGDTRSRILEAAMNLLADQGYAASSTLAITKAAGLSRTAMLYHFPSRQALLEAIVHFVTRRRLELQEESHASLPTGINFRAQGVDSHWAQLQSIEFRAFCQLSLAASTNPELEAVFKPALAAFDRARKEMAMKLAEPELSALSGFDLKRDIQRFLLEGIAQQNGITFSKRRRMRDILAFIKLCWTDEGQAFIERALSLSSKQSAK
ncbi:MAG: TetR/AcrR family transcriptional regulator [Pseudomonadaceae bacterium]|nr:TetR/AcrR family transcriptional regulator [Pseudomonadaceae bacterium]